MDVDPRLAERLAGGGAEVELEAIEGELFTSAPPTPWLKAVIEQAAAELERNLASDPAAHVVTQEPIALGPRTVVRPDVAVLGADGPPRLVVEVRTESTDRYALGPKRMAYARGRVPEYWFLDPHWGRVVLLRLDEGEPDYTWPGVELGRGDVCSSAACEGLVVEVDRLLRDPSGQAIQDVVAEKLAATS